ncbi:MAG: hypothetical protein IJR90_06155 [Clostridia bacterium]|nr:hypothetical protein [Clostridia bacterium]
MSITEKAAYLKGLMDGMKLDETKDETKLLRALVSTVSELADEIADTQDDVDTLNAYVEEIDEDLGAVEEYVFGGDDLDCDFDCENCEDAENCEYADEDYEPEDEEAKEEE